MIQRDHSPNTLALAIPFLHQIVEKTRGTEGELENAGVLSSALRRAGRYTEAEITLRELMEHLIKQGNYRLASTGTGELFIILLATGRFEEALQIAEEKAEYIRRAGLGPWSQLAAEGQRLQALNALGRYAEVMEAVEQHRITMKDLPEDSEFDETVNPWNVRETMLDVGWQQPLSNCKSVPADYPRRSTIWLSPLSRLNHRLSGRCAPS